MALYVINFILIFTVIFNERKAPSATLAWIMVLAFIPIVGFIFTWYLTRTFHAVRSAGLRRGRKLPPAAPSKNRWPQWIPENMNSAQREP